MNAKATVLVTILSALVSLAAAGLSVAMFVQSRQADGLAFLIMSTLFAGLFAFGLGALKK